MPPWLPFGVRRLDAATVYLLICAIDAFRQRLIYTLLAIYYVTVVGMDPLQLVLVGTVLEGACLLFEVPTGVIADVYSRRLSIILGYLLIGMAFMLEGSVSLFALILLGEVIRAIGESCLSGATQAWLADEVGEARLGILFLRGAQLRRGCGLLGIGASVGLGSLDLAVPVIVGGGLSIALAGWLAVCMPEHGFRPQPRTSHADGLRRTVSAGIGQLRQKPFLLVFLGIAAAAGASSEGFDRLWEAHLLTAYTFPSLGVLQPIVWFGIFNAVGSLLSIVVAQALTRLDLTDDRVIARYGLLAHSGWLVAVIVFGLAPDFTLAALAFWISVVLRGVGQPLMSTWVTRSIPSEVRATVLSTLSQGDAFGQMLGGPGIGMIGRVYSLRVALVATGLLHAPVLILLTRARRLLNEPTSAPPDPASEPDTGNLGVRAP
jgi:DHA3 family tetracycline resistance protein-like MFS transporter